MREIMFVNQTLARLDRLNRRLGKLYCRFWAVATALLAVLAAGFGLATPGAPVAFRLIPLLVALGCFWLARDLWTRQARLTDALDEFADQAPKKPAAATRSPARGRKAPPSSSC